MCCGNGHSLQGDRGSEYKHSADNIHHNACSDVMDAGHSSAGHRHDIEEHEALFRIWYSGESRITQHVFKHASNPLMPICGFPSSFAGFGRHEDSSFPCEDTTAQCRSHVCRPRCLCASTTAGTKSLWIWPSSPKGYMELCTSRQFVFRSTRMSAPAVSSASTATRKLPPTSKVLSWTRQEDKSQAAEPV